jgi:hypothetical protein
LQFVTNGVVRTTLDSSGNLLVGTTSSVAATYLLQVANGVFNSVNTSLISITDTATVYRGTPDGTGFEHAKVYSGRDTNTFSYGSYLAFYTEGKNSGTTDTSAERARIDSSGNLLVGTTTATGFFNVTSTLNGYSSYILNTNASFTSSVARFDAYRNTTNGSYFFIECSVSGVAQRFGVLDSGAVLSATLLGGVTTLSVDANGYIVRTVSDAALKTNVAPITYGLDTVLKLKPIKHEWVESANMGGPSIGFIAQDMELEVPEIVSGTEYKSIDYPKLTAILTKAIQEQQALITSLTARITALEST